MIGEGGGCGSCTGWCSCKLVALPTCGKGSCRGVGVLARCPLCCLCVCQISLICRSTALCDHCRLAMLGGEGGGGWLRRGGCVPARGCMCVRMCMCVCVAVFVCVCERAFLCMFAYMCIFMSVPQGQRN